MVDGCEITGEIAVRRLNLRKSRPEVAGAEKVGFRDDSDTHGTVFMRALSTSNAVSHPKRESHYSFASILLTLLP